MWLGLVLAFGSSPALVFGQNNNREPKKTDANPRAREHPRHYAHTTLNSFMELYRKDDPASTKQMIEYLDQSQLDEEAKQDIATLAVRLAEFMATNEIATKAMFEELKQLKRDDESVREYCLYYATLTEIERKAVASTTDQKKPDCQIQLIKAGDHWQFDGKTVARISLLTAQKEPEIPKTAKTEVSPETPSVAPTAEAPAPLKVPDAFASPQATMRTFLEAYDKKTKNPKFPAECLNLEGWGVQPQDRQAKILADALKFVLDRTVYVEFLEIPNDPETKSPYLYRVVQEQWNIELERMENGRWLFSASMLEPLQQMFRAVADSPPKVPDAPELSFRSMPELWLFSALPAWAQQRVWILEIWQWLGLLGVFLGGIVADRLARVILRRISAAIVRHLEAGIDTRLENTALRPIGLVILGYVWLELFQVLWLPKPLGNILTNAAWFIVVFAGIWATYRVIDVLSGYTTIVASRRKSKFDKLLVPFGRKILKVLVTIIGLIYFASRILPPNQIGALLGGLGLGGLAFALAAQDTLKNLFGSITVMLDRPFEIGDWIKVGEVEGTVESVGFRSTRIRTFYHSQINVPNGKLIDAVVDNLGRRKYRRISCKLGLTYDTPPEKIDAFCEGVRELIRRHPYTRKDYYHVYFNEFGAASLNILLYCFHEAPDWSTELRERHRLFSDILRLARQLGVEFAFPTQTLHLHNADETTSSVNGRPAKADELAPDIVGRSEAAAITKLTVPPPDTLAPVKIEKQPQPVDDDYVKQRLGTSGDGRPETRKD